MRQHSGKSLFIAALLTGTLGYSSGAFARCVPSVWGDLSAYKLGNNTCIGNSALGKMSFGRNNSALSFHALANNTGGYANSAVGAFALELNISGDENTAMGMKALATNNTGNNNTATGNFALADNKVGNQNTALGDHALALNTTGSSNVAVGYHAGVRLTSGNNNIDIANQGVAGDSATIRIGSTGTQTKTFLAGVYGSAVTGSTVTVNSSGQLGVALSSRRYKEDIKPMDSVSDKLLELRPVTFHYKKPDEDGKKPIQYGLIAEEVDAVMPELVVRNKDGSPETVAYQYIPTLLLNEYQKQHKELVDTKAKLASIEKTSAQKMAEMQSQIDKLNAITKKLMAALPSNTETAMAK